MTSHTLSRLAAAWLSAAIFVTAGTVFAAEPVRVGATYITNGTDPAKGSNGWALVSHGVGENLFTVDRDGKLVPELAEKAQRTGDLTWTVTLKHGRLFSDGTPMTAKALAAGFDNTFASNKAALATGGKLTFEAADDLTLKVTTEKPVPFIQALFAEWPLIAYKPTSAGNAVFSGPYRISAFKTDASITLEPNVHFAGADKRSPVNFRKFGDAQTLTLALEAGELDLAFGLPSEVVSRLQTNPDLAIKSFPVGYQYLAFFNTARPPMDDVKVRQAIDLAFDRKELATAINGGDPATGAYASYFPFAGREARPIDPAKAAALLDEAGWAKGSGGMREKGGKPLRLLVITYPQRPDLVTMLPVVKAELAKIGIAIDTQVVENIQQMAAAGDFDIALWAQHTAPSGDAAFFLNSMLRSGASLNYAKYASRGFDAILDRFATEGNPEKRVAIALDAQQKLFDDAPASFLVSPVWYVGLSKRLKNYEPWGSDYHVLRADIGEAE
ncbi:Dipeptide ABC transporter, substrate-binding protein, putative (plasmid) [Neorhizobium galegae bv. officinalis bv. officinalis str. HAMBI 1141]|uniref:Dipeptide ABC transporter, substrate-binding protein, putative n=1 Tax=Neorhizobium galegae bv. officinalis bv. officinalis str. HAMBI 1141 TaxID=1028801 RepID=A0A068THB0_NEOGA|nr:ABC transporter substrate-binding protein [Neorhizobium galegae]CDN57763.1 Dipeptide ABC transporter, substrate-binding protein, putative [Neorhizobium galegae bv. officinalis bv. officinalis str. HAMBI 1141]